MEIKPGLISEASVSWRVNAERIVLLGWSRAILMQIAHPLVAAGVEDHSSFREGHLTAAYRLHHTVRAMLSLTFGTEAQRAATLARINGIHRRVNGTLPRAVGPYPAGTRYSAEDPELLLWVHATLLDSLPAVYELLIAPLSAAERDEYCREAAAILPALGVPEGMAPESWSAFREYMDRMYASGQIVVSDTARALAASVLAPPWAPLVAPAARMNRLITVGLLPPQIRQQYGFEWNERSARALRRWVSVLSRVRRIVPPALALWPESRPPREARRRTHLPSAR